MSELRKLYSANIKLLRSEVKLRVREAQRGYDALPNKDSDYAVVLKSFLDLHIASAEIYNDASDEIVFEHEAF